MKRAVTENTKKEHAPDCTCSLCGQNYKSFSFKSGYVCESCVQYIKDNYITEKQSDSNKNK